MGRQVRSAVVVAVELSEKENIQPDFDAAGFCNRLLAFLYQRLVRYTETVVRRAVRLDKPIDGEEIQADNHPALRDRVDMGEAPADPLNQLIAKEEASRLATSVTVHESRAAAYYHLLERCNSSMRVAAEVLRISLSYCYFRFNEAKGAVSVQENLHPIVGDSAFCPGPWRSFKMTANRQWEQLPLDFGATLF